jgi:glucose/arabinose dehydrogenase
MAACPGTTPLWAEPGALPEIWSYGHRNPQGATLGPDGRLWMHEHGPQGGDEINLPQPGRNYGWPVITFGEQYGGGPIGAGITAKGGHGTTAAPLDAVDRALGHGLSDQ